MNWFKDMLMLFGEWVLLMLIPLLLGIFIGWIIWHKKGDKSEVKQIKSESDDLTAIKNIDSDIQNKLNEKGIDTYKELALLSEKDVDRLEQDLGLGNDIIRNENWISQAAQLHFEKYGEKIYDKVKVAPVYKDAFEEQIAQANKGMKFDYTDDLKIISGVGPKMEKLLHDFGITTFYHLSKLDKDGVAALNEKLEFFPGRIERDEWVAQAEELHKKLH